MLRVSAANRATLPELSRDVPSAINTQERTPSIALGCMRPVAVVALRVEPEWGADGDSWTFT